MSEYWWDRSGRDAELERLETLLRPLAFGGGRVPEAARRGRSRFLLSLGTLAATIAAIALWFQMRAGTPVGWQVLALAGTPRVSGAAATPNGRLYAEQVLETGPDARARIIVGKLGAVDVEPGSRLRLVDEGRHRLALEHGALRAFISAPPRRFSIETREALAVDLGCAYTLAVDPSGDGLLRVSFGWVALETEKNQYEMYVPAGAACALHAGHGPGTPYFEDASERFREALSALDRGRFDERSRDALLSEARPRDGLSLLYALERMELPWREATYDRLAELVAPPPGVDREAVLRGRGKDWNRWWDTFHLPEMKWWTLAPR